MSLMVDVFKGAEKPILLSFGDDRFAQARLRIKTEAMFSRFFGEVRIFAPADLPVDLRAFCEKTAADTRGYGYYLWKPYLVNRIASDPKYDGKIVFWVDSGSWINRMGLSEYVKYQEVMTDEKPFVVFEREDYEERQCVKRDVFHHLDAEMYINTPPLMAGIFGVRVNKLSRSIISRWYEESSRNIHLIDESPSTTGPEYPGFESNRNDQGVLSLLLKKSACYTKFSGGHILPELHESYLAMTQYPFIAMRDRSMTD
jgi:hypothetical protein